MKNERALDGFVSAATMRSQQNCRNMSFSIALYWFIYTDGHKGVLWQKSEDTDGMPQNATFHRGLHC